MIEPKGSPASQLQDWWVSKGKQKYQHKPAFAAAVGVSHPAVKLWFRGSSFPRDEQCEKLYEITERELDCFGPGRDAARAEFEQLIPRAVKNARRAEYIANAGERRHRSRVSWRKRYDEQRVRVLDEELAALRLDPRRRKNVCRECGEILRDVGPHLGPAHNKMKVAEYKKKWGFLRSRNATRSEGTNAKQSAAMKRGRHRPPKYTHKLLPKANLVSLQVNRPGTATLEERLNARSRKLAPRPDHWKRDADGRIISDAKIAQFRLAGVPEEKIAMRVGLSLTALHFRLKRMNYTGHAAAVLHGEPVGPKHFLGLCEEFGLTPKQAAKRIGLSSDWASRRLTGNRAGEPVSFEMGKAIIEVRTELKAKFSAQPASRRGGRPSQLTPSEKAELPAKHDSLSGALRKLRTWIQGQDKTAVPESALWNFLCEGFRIGGDLDALRFWPQFFSWVSSNVDTFRSGKWVPHELSLQFLAADYGASESAVYEALHRAR